MLCASWAPTGRLVRASGKHGAEAQIQMRVVVAIAGETPALMRRRTQVQQSRARAIKSGLASAPAHGGDGVATSILIVDDSKLARIVVGKAVAAIRPDWERVEAGSAAEALELADGSRDRCRHCRLQHARPEWPRTCRGVAPAQARLADCRRHGERSGRDRSPARGRRTRPSCPSQSPKKNCGRSWKPRRSS